MSRGRGRTPPTGVSIPRAHTPADEVLAAAIASVRRDHPDWQLAEVVTRALEHLGERTAELEADKAARDRVITGLKRWVWAASGGALSALGIAAAFAAGVVGDAGEKRGATREREARQIEDRATLLRTQDQLQGLAREHAQLVGEVRGLYPIRVYPMGPRNRHDDMPQE